MLRKLKVDCVIIVVPAKTELALKLPKLEYALSTFVPFPIKKIDILEKE